MDWSHLLRALLLLNLGVYVLAGYDNSDYDQNNDDEVDDNDDDNKPTCGTPVEIDSRIVGGQDAMKGKNPWQAIVWIPGSGYCGGALISSNLVVTVAHCIDGFNASSVVVILGAYKITGNPNEENSVPVQQIIIHPGYNESDNSADIALLQLSQNVPITRYIQPVCVPSASTVFPPGQNCVVTGWGDIELSVIPQRPVVLQETQVRLMSTEQCKSYYDSKGVGSFIKDDMICAVDILGQRGPCLGDGGGPLITYQNKQWNLVGVASFGFGCGNENPAVYTSVRAYIDWIQQYIYPIDD